jgi:hypothetical protein
MQVLGNQMIWAIIFEAWIVNPNNPGHRHF